MGFFQFSRDIRMDLSSAHNLFFLLISWLNFEDWQISEFGGKTHTDHPVYPVACGSIDIHSGNHG